MAGESLKDASFALQKDKEVVTTAVLANAKALKYAGDDLKSDKDVALSALKSETNADMVLSLSFALAFSSSPSPLPSLARSLARACARALCVAGDGLK